PSGGRDTVRDRARGDLDGAGRDGNDRTVRNFRPVHRKRPAVGGGAGAGRRNPGRPGGRSAMKIASTGETLGATVEGVDLNTEIDRQTFSAVLRALGEYGVLRFPHQHLEPARQMAFSQRFGALEINVAGAFQEPGHPEVMILSNMKDARG